MAKHTKSGKKNKNLLMHITNNHVYSVKESTKCREDNTPPGYTDDSRQCENLNQSIDDLRNYQTAIVKKDDILETILSSSQQHCDSVSFQDVSTRATCEYRLHTRKPQARQLRRYKTDTKEDNRIVSYEAQIEHVRDKTRSQNRTHATKIKGHILGYHKSTKPQRYKTTTKTEVSSTKASIAKPLAGADTDLMTKSNKISKKYSKNVATKSQLKSILNQTPRHQFGDSLEQFETLEGYEEQMAEMLESRGNGKKQGKPRRSVRTMICLDNSEAMKGPSWTKAVTFAKNLIQEVKSEPCRDSRVFERIGLVTFGYETRVQVHLTREYHQLLSKLDTLRPGGPTRMRAGLEMCAAAIKSEDRCGATLLNGMHISPRIILITDGKTASNLGREGSDFSCTQDKDESVVMLTVQNLTKGCQVHIDCVSLAGGKIDFLTKIAQTTRGKVYHCEDWKKLGRRTKYLMLAGQHYDDFLSTGEINFIRHVISTHRDVKREDIDIIVETMRRSKESNEHCFGNTVNGSMEDEDNHYIGTVLGHDKNSKSWISVDQDKNVGAVIKRTRQARYGEVRSSNRKSHEHNYVMNEGYGFQLRESYENYNSNKMAVKETELVETNEMDHAEVHDIDVEEMNRKNLEMSKLYITLPGSVCGVKESLSLKPEDNKVKMDAEVTTLDHNAKRNKNRR